MSSKKSTPITSLEQDMAAREPKTAESTVKNNFKAAFKELLGKELVNDAASSSEADSTVSISVKETEKAASVKTSSTNKANEATPEKKNNYEFKYNKIEDQKKNYTYPNAASNANNSPSKGTPLYASKPEPVLEPIMPELADLPNLADMNFEAATFITNETVIEGSITTKSKIKVDGMVKGDILSENDILISGKVDGDIQGKSVVLKDGIVQGNVSSESTISLNAKSVVIGDLSANDFDSDGKIKGNIQTTSSIALKSNAIVFGNITSKSINMQDGAVVKGNIQITMETTEGDDFFTSEDFLKDLQ